MFTIFMIFIESLINSMMDFLQLLTMNLTEKTFYIEKSMNIEFAGVKRIFVDFGISLLILKFLKKGFDRYIVWSDGDVNSEVSLLVINFLKGIIIILTFPVLYTWLADTVLELTNNVLAELNFENSIITTTIMTSDGKGAFVTILILIFLIMYLTLYIQFLARGIEILVLRIGLPLACVGIMDSNGGVFATYIKKLFQSLLTIMIQIILLNLGMLLMLQVDPLLAIATLMLAIKTPRFLSEFMVVSQSSNVSSKIGSSVRTASSFRKIIGK